MLNNYLTALAKLSRIKILVIGDMMLDHYIWGDVYRISPEAPVPIVQVENDTYTAGGSANVALNLANLGAETYIIGYCGNDEAGIKLKSILKINNVTFLENFVEEPEIQPTIIKTRVLVRNQQLCRIDREASQNSYSISDYDKFDTSLREILDKVDAVIVSDYAKGIINQKIINSLLDYSEKTRNILIALDPKPTRELSFKGMGLITPNKSEALLLAGIQDVSSTKQYPLEDICRIIHEKYSPKLLVITLGPEGMAVCKDGVILKILPTEAKEVYDVSGAGDTVIATIVSALSAGETIISASKLANIAAACVISHLGTAPIQLTELLAMVNKVNQAEN